ncbi:hypothetical protein WT59_21850 [Burkholderia territorii]|uniref:response regulator n=1 Tax=Burkholderia territorii TaxID=1503055 RepID=UPI0007572A42|nr:response regulator [Burkholderia territorii]KWH08460.1 hypothetical protein WT59_21850 [Burkholderia territorii]
MIDKYKVRVAIADDHPAVVAGIKHSIASAGIEVVGDARDSTEIVALLKQVECDVLITDYAMPGGEFGDGLALFTFLTRHFPDVKIITVTMMDNPGVLRSICNSGVRCVLNKADDVSHLVPAIHVAYSGGRYFSPKVSAALETGAARGKGEAGGRPRGGRKTELSKREVEVMRLYVSGMKVTEIAEHLRRSDKTVSAQKMSAMKKIGATSDVELLKYALETGLLSSSEGATDNIPAGE